MLVSATVDVRGLVKIFNGNVRAVDGVSFSANDAEIFGLLGPNGAGKTTIIKILAAQIKATAGEAFISGRDANKHANKVRNMIGYVPQDVPVQGDLTGYECVRMLETYILNLYFPNVSLYKFEGQSFISIHIFNKFYIHLKNETRNQLVGFIDECSQPNSRIR